MTVARGTQLAVVHRHTGPFEIDVIESRAKADDLVRERRRRKRVVNRLERIVLGQIRKDVRRARARAIAGTRYTESKGTAYTRKVESCVLSGTAMHDITDSATRKRANGRRTCARTSIHETARKGAGSP